MDIKFLETVSSDGTLSRASFLLLFYMYLTKKFVGTQSKLGDILNMERKTVNQSVGVLESRNYIKRTPLRNDKRIKKIEFIGGKNG